MDLISFQENSYLQRMVRYMYLIMFCFFGKIIMYIQGSHCLTIDHYPCKFPFWYEGKVNFRCTNEKRSDLPRGSQWCPIDSKKLYFKSIGICSESCIQRTYFPCFTFLSIICFGKISQPSTFCYREFVNYIGSRWPK